MPKASRSPTGSMWRTAIYPTTKGIRVPRSPKAPAHSIRSKRLDGLFPTDRHSLSILFRSLSFQKGTFRAAIARILPSLLDYAVHNRRPRLLGWQVQRAPETQSGSALSPFQARGGGVVSFPTRDPHN